MSPIIPLIAIGCVAAGLLIAGATTWWVIGVRHITITEAPIARRVYQLGAALAGLGLLLTVIAEFVRS